MMEFPLPSFLEALCPYSFMQEDIFGVSAASRMRGGSMLMIVNSRLVRLFVSISGFAVQYAIYHASKEFFR